MYALMEKTKEEKKQLTLDSREVAEMVEKRHDHLLRDIGNYIGHIREVAEPNFGVSDFFIESSYQDITGRKLKCYEITRKGCEFVSNKLTGQKGTIFTATYINKFHSMEKVLREQNTTPQIDSKFMYLLAQQLEEQEKQIQIMKPKVIFADAITTSKNSILIGELAKLLATNGVEGIGQNRLFEWLRANGYIHKEGEQRNLPTQRSIELKIMEVKTRTINNSDGSIRVTKTTKINGKGQIYFVNKFLRAKQEVQPWTYQK